MRVHASNPSNLKAERVPQVQASLNCIVTSRLKRWAELGKWRNVIKILYENFNKRS